jgi:hypothetical protein
MRKYVLPYGGRRALRRGWRLAVLRSFTLSRMPLSGAAKIGVSDAPGSRIAEHRRAGWQLLAAFQVTAKAAVAIEDEVLRWWRAELGLPPFLWRDQMPQGGWTETVAAGRVDLAATVTRICNLAVQQDARPSRSQDGRLAC